MITKLAIQNFRGLKSVTLDHLRRVTILVGGNDTGKTSVLEALTLLLGDGAALQSLPLAFRSNQQTGQPSKEHLPNEGTRDDFENFWLWLFYDRDLRNRISLIASTSDGTQVQLNSEERSSPSQATVLFRVVEAGKRETPLIIRQTNIEPIPGLASPPNLRVSRLSIRPSDPVEDAERYNQVALNAGGELRIE